MDIYNSNQILYKHIVPDGVQNVRFRQYAQENFKLYYPTNKSIKKAIDHGLFYVNELKANTGNLINTGDIIILMEAEFDPGIIFPLDLEIIFEDEHFAIINKPSGINIHNQYKRNIVNALPHNIKKSQAEDALMRPMPVHRLDSVTSGLLIIAKTRSFQSKMGQMLEKRLIEKSYLAIVIGKLEGSGIFDKKVDDKEAETEYMYIEHCDSSRFGSLSLVKLLPKTGRTHQLRIHCADAGFPILGERLYATDMDNLRGKGLFLCAYKLEFEHPISKEKVFFSIYPPNKFLKYFSVNSG